ncbi:hypothetical protein L1049_021125 [Liquidambar formosana]|uniref:Uncharacterized protein n=1 Tax=Liquidambar formosana TaxID=63359 RepID=A0AAP0X4V5_LIQFO
MEEIFASEEGEVADETTFGQLNSLKLRNLANLVRFCQGSNTFSFLSLEEVLVEECPCLKTFSNGIINTPALKKVYVQWDWTIETLADEWVWKDDLNTTIQHLFRQKV